MKFRASSAFSFLFYSAVAVCFVAPLAWVGLTLLAEPAAWSELWLDAFRLRLLGRTLFYNSLVAMIATIIAIPAAVALGRGRGTVSRGLVLFLPVSLLLPSIAFEYGWKQALLLGGVFPSPQSVGDVARCIWTLAAWLWPIPACIGAIVLRRFDVSILEQSAIDGVLNRFTLRVLIRPLLAGAAIVLLLASQEFAVFEPSGISVVATEVRMVFDTGAYSSSTNPITQVFGAGGGEAIGAPSQSARSAAAIVTAMPLAATTVLIAALAWWASRRLAVEGELHVGRRPTVLRAPRWSVIAGYLVIGITSGLPLVALLVAHKSGFSPQKVWATFSPQVIGSIFLATMTMTVSIAMALFQLARPRRGMIALAAVCFLLGGQMLAIGLIRLFNRNITAFIYDSFAIAVLAYAARFGWLALAAGGMTWQRGWVSLRELAAIDGASPGQTLRSVVLPLAWPVLLAAGLLVAVLSLTEVAATVLLSPQNPQPLVPMLLQWVHLQRYDAMIEGTLLLSCVVSCLAVLAVVLGAFGRRAFSALAKSP
ncbi:MAG TPA: hypothetical protein PLD59_05585 [Tepidisphaeraceae bacterium]|nr:hypothetical protein [Tepidisphaeraceae bacterium]